MRLGLERRLLPTALGAGILLAEFEPRTRSLLPGLQLPTDLDLLMVILGAIVCIGLPSILFLIIAFVRAGGRRGAAEMPREGAPTAVKTCPECGHVITRPQERFCIECGAMLPH